MDNQITQVGEKLQLLLTSGVVNSFSQYIQHNMQAETNSIAALLSSNTVNNSSTPTPSVTSMVSQPMDIQEINLSSVPNAEVASQSTVAQEIDPEVLQPS